MQTPPKRFLSRLLGFERARPGERRLKTLLLHALRGALAQATGKGLVSCFSEVPRGDWRDEIQGVERGFWKSVAKGEVPHEAWHHLDPETLAGFGLDTPASDGAPAMDLGCGPRGVLAGFRRGNKIFVDQRGSMIRVVFPIDISAKLFDDISSSKNADWILGYVDEIMPYVNQEILNQRYRSGHFLLSTYSVMDISQLWVVNRQTRKEVRLAWPKAITGFPPAVELASKYDDRVYVRDIIDSFHAYFSGNYEECIRKAITSVETFIKFHELEVSKAMGGLDFEKTIRTHMNIICPMTRESAADVIWDTYKIRNDIVHEGKRINPEEGRRAGKRATHLINEVYKNFGTEEDIKRYAFYLEGQFLSHENFLGGGLTLQVLEENKSELKG